MLVINLNFCRIGSRDRFPAQLTVFRGVVDEDDLAEELDGRPVDDGVDGSEQRRESLVVEDDDDGDLRQTPRIHLGFAAEIIP